MHQATVAAFLNQKGGVGKTTSVVNIGAGLTILGKKVCIVDLDPQGHLTTFLGIDSNRIDNTIYDVMRGKASARDAIIEQPLGARFSIDGQESQLSMCVIPSDLNLSEAERTLSLSSRREHLLRDAFSTISGSFDYVLFDCPPSLGLLSTNALVAANKVYVPVQAEYLALESLENLFKMIEGVMDELNPDLEIGGLIATRFDGRKVINRSVVESLKERFGVLLLETVIRENIVLAESPSRGKDIFTYRPKSNGAEDYLNLCLEVMGQMPMIESHLTVERGTISRVSAAQMAS